jgi:8-oxo-dGTP pyrophosphatase MutT (NUDIX family)
MERIEIIDENNTVIKIVSDQEMREKALLHKSTFIVVITNDGRFYFPKRSKNKIRFPGDYELGAGGVKDIGETVEECAKRELMEELGIINQDLEPLFEYKQRSKDDNYNAMIYLCVYDGLFILQKEEVEEGVFVSIAGLKDFLEKSKFAPGRKEILKKVLKSNALNRF